MKGFVILVGVVAATAAAAIPHPASLSARGSGAAVVRQEPDGRMLYLRNCRTCHGANGVPSAETRAQYPEIKTLNDKVFLDRMSDADLLKVLKEGKGKDMKSWAGKLTVPEMEAVIKYVRTLPMKKQ